MSALTVSGRNKERDMFTQYGSQRFDLGKASKRKPFRQVASRFSSNRLRCTAGDDAFIETGF